MNPPAMDNSIQVFWDYMYFSVRYIFSSGIMGSYSMFSFNITMWCQFSKVVIALYILLVMYKSSHSATFLLKLGLVHLLNFSYFVSLFYYFVINLICIFRITKVVELRIICWLATCWSHIPIFIGLLAQSTVL